MPKALAPAAFAAVLSFAGAANAGDIYAGGPAYPGDPSGGSVACRVFNAGAATVTIKQRQIIANPGVFVRKDSDTCNVALAPLKYCAFTAAAKGNLAYMCRLTTVESETNLRGVVEVFGPINPNGPSAEVVVPLTK